MRLYLTSMAGGYSFIFWFSVVGFLCLCELFGVFQTYWLGYWAQQYEDRDQADVKVS